MITVYVIQSLKNMRLYIGVTERNPVERLAEHNAGKTESNLMNRPYKLVYHETFKSLEIALKRERFLKSGKGREILKTKINGQNAILPPSV